MMALKIPGMLEKIAEKKYIGALKDIDKISKGIGILNGQIENIQKMYEGKKEIPAIFKQFINPLLGGIKTDLGGVEGFDGTNKAIESTKKGLKGLEPNAEDIKNQYNQIKTKVIEQMDKIPNKSAKNSIESMQNIISQSYFKPVLSPLKKKLPSTFLLFLIEKKSMPDTIGALTKFTVDKIKEAKGIVQKKINKATGTTPAPTATTTTPATTTPATTTPATTPATTEKPKDTTTKTTEKSKEVPKTSFGKRKRGPSASLKRMCKKHGVRLMVKRGKKRVYKSSKVLKEQCKNKLKKNKKKNFGRKKIKRSSIMPPKRKRRGKKRSRLSSAARGARKRASAAARYARKNPGASALGGALGLGALGLGGYEAYSKYKRSRGDDSYYSPSGRAFTRAKGGVMGTYDYFTKSSREQIKKDIMGLPPAAKQKVIDAAEAAGKGITSRTGIFDRFFPNTQGAENRRTAKLFAELPGEGSFYGKRRRRRRRSSYEFGGQHEKHGGSKCSHNYGKRRRKKRSFGKKAKKPSAATRRMCKKLKVRMTLKRGGKRVYKSEAMLKKQCKKAMKRKSKK